MRRRILYISAADEPAEERRPYFADSLEQVGFDIDTFYVSAQSSRARIRSALCVPRRFAAYDLIIVSEYFLAWGCALRATLERSRAKLVVVGLNQSRRLIHFRSGVLERLNRAIWNRFDQAVVSSRAEARIFTKLHGIDPARFSFIHWGYDLPEVRSDRFAGRTVPYVCMIGRNNRDVETFCRAVDEAGVVGVLISPAGPIAVAGGVVEHYLDLSLDDCLSCIQHALANIILVTDENRGAGHITAVNAMFLGVPQIFSKVETIEDYLVDGFNGIAVPVGSHVEVAAAIRELASDKALAMKLGANGRAFAQRYMSNAAVVNRLRQVVQYLLGDMPKPEDNFSLR